MNLLTIDNKILSNELLSMACFANVNLDQVLEGRENKQFDKLWIGSFNRLKLMSLSEQDKNQIDKIREHSFKMTYKNCADHDLSAYVSDDFELISKAILLNLNDPFINSLWMSYRNNQIPGGEMVMIEGCINEL